MRLFKDPPSFRPQPEPPPPPMPLALSRTLVRVGWGRAAAASSGSERRLLGEVWVDASQVDAVMATEKDAVYYRERCVLLFRSGQRLTVFGRPQEVLTQLAGGVPSDGRPRDFDDLRRS